MEETQSGLEYSIFEAYARYIISALLALVIIIGVAGNFINVVVFSHKSMRIESTFRYLLYLAVVDLLVLLVCTSEAFVKFGFHYEIRNQSSILCSVHSFLTYFLPQCSSVILMIVNVDRAFKLKHIHKRKKPLTGYKCYHRVDVVLCTAITTLLILNSHFILFLRLDHSDDYYGSSVCYPVQESHLVYRNFLHVWIWIDLFIYCIVPFMVMVLCSIYIVAKILARRRQLNANLISNPANKRIFLKNVQRNRQMFTMLLFTNFYFLLSSLPYCTAFIVFQNSTSESSMAQSGVHFLFYTNNAVNFLVYGLSSQRYRNELIKLFQRKRDFISTHSLWHSNYVKAVEIRKS